MPRRQTDTRAEIRATALGLFAQHGFAGTSLRQIAEQLGITKAALYYHFPSKDALLAEIIDPMIAAGESYLAEAEAAAAQGRPDRAAVIGGYYDFIRNHRRVMELLLHDLGSVARVGTIVDAVLSWRERLSAVLFGPEPAAAQRAMAVVAFGGVMDAAAFDRDGDPAFKEAVVGAALRALSG
ncbi:TetR/AcrR family transcriptional regulator [Nocardiopsis coralliicola]